MRMAHHLHVPIVMKSGSLNVLEPSGPVQTCNWIALPYYTTNQQPAELIVFLNP